MVRSNIYVHLFTLDYERTTKKKKSTNVYCLCIPLYDRGKHTLYYYYYYFTARFSFCTLYDYFPYFRDQTLCKWRVLFRVKYSERNGVVQPRYSTRITLFVQYVLYMFTIFSTKNNFFWTTFPFFRIFTEK